MRTMLESKLIESQGFAIVSLLLTTLRLLKWTLVSSNGGKACETLEVQMSASVGCHLPQGDLSAYIGPLAFKRELDQQNNTKRVMLVGKCSLPVTSQLEFYVGYLEQRTFRVYQSITMMRIRLSKVM